MKSLVYAVTIVVLVIGAVAFGRFQVADAQVSKLANQQTRPEGTIACTPPPAGIAAWYRGEDNGLDVFDLNDGTLLNGVSYTTGKVGRSFDLDGVNDYVQMDVDVQPSAMSEVTFEAWVFPRSPTGADQAIIGGDDGGWDRQLGISPDGISFRAQTGTIASFDAVPVDYNQWQHVAVVYSSTNVKVYKNGVEYSFGSAPTGQASVNKLALGSNRCPLCITNSATQQFNGLIDEATVYDRALSQTELQSIYNANSGGKCLYCTPAPVGMTSWYQAENDTNDVRSRINGTPQGGIGYAPGKIGQAFNFDGIDDTVELGTGMASHDFSLSMWVKPGATQIQYADIVDNNHSKFQNWVIQQDASNTNMYAFSGTPPFPLAPDVWQHLVVTHDSSDNSRAYVDGVLVASGTYAITYNGTQFLRLGRWANFHPDQGGNRFWNGQMDEFAIFDRALTPIEVRNMYQAGGNGMCRPTATTPPSGVVGWWGGDGDALDISGNGNNGTMQNGALFAVEKVGQGFKFDGVDDYVSVATSQSLDVGSGNGFTLETWIDPVTLQGEQPIFEWNTGGPAEANLGLHFWMSVVSQGGVSGNLYGNLIDGAGISHRIQTPAVMTAGQFQHVALTYDKTNGTASIYRNGVLILSQNLGAITPRTSMPLYLGFRPGSLIFNGQLDEPSVYSRTLNPAEIASIYEAGLAGKLKTANTNADPPTRPTIRSSRSFTQLSPGAVNTQVGDVTVNFASVTTPGITQQIPLDLSLMPPLPMGATSIGLTYDVDTSAAYSGNVNLCFNVPGLTSTPAGNLRVYHMENGAWVDRTASGATHAALCTTGVTSLSPFALAVEVPLAADVSISGRVTTAEGRGIRNAVITLTDLNGNPRNVIAGVNGFYRFDAVETGQTYILSIRSRRFQFDNPTRVISVVDNISGEDFSALPLGNKGFPQTVRAR